MKKVVREFPKEVMTSAPGITISQTYVEIIGNDFKSAVDAVEKNLKIQRNKPMNSLTVGLMGIQRSRTTGLPAVEKKIIDNKEVFYDEAVWKKQQKVKSNNPNENANIKVAQNNFGKNEIILAKNYPFDIQKLTTKNDWIAVVHIDGNGLGKIVESIGYKPNILRYFSKALSEATISATQDAYNNLKDWQVKNKENIYPYPIRPLIIGGDDYTFIIRGDLAVPYVMNYLQAFESKTKEKFNNKEFPGLSDEIQSVLGRDYLTACAGIAFIKSSYPFYYGYDLAEELCGKAKKVTREKSSLMFHKVQDSFIEDWGEIAKRELHFAYNNGSFEFGPYFLDNPKENYWTIQNLIDEVDYLDKDESESLKTHLRILADMMKNGENTVQKIMRVKSVLKEENGRKIDMYINGYVHDDKKVNPINPIYDVLSVYSIKYQETK